MEKENSRYTLMHKYIPVAEITIDGASGAIISVSSAYNENHVPIGILVKNKTIDRKGLNDWWTGRAIPAGRSGIRNALEKLGMRDTRLLPEKCMGLSLSDQYWVRPAGSDLSWDQINFFENPFSEDMGSMLFGRETGKEHISLMSPDNTSDGWLKKRWAVINGRRCLIKGGSGTTRQETYNEVIASRICARLGIPHIEYSIIEEDGVPYSICEDFVTPETELIPAWSIMRTEKWPNHISPYQHFLNCCENLGIPGMKESLDRMLVLDYLIENQDRHFNNFGAIRNAATLEYLGAAPIYDSGTSLWFNTPDILIGKEKTDCEPFRDSHEKQIELVSDFSWLDLLALDGLKEELKEIIKDSLFISETRCNALCARLAQRRKMLEKHIENREHT